MRNNEENEDDFWGNMQAWTKGEADTGFQITPSSLPVVATSDSSADPVDIWLKNAPPVFPKGLLPPLIERFAQVRATTFGGDPAGLAMAAITTCASVLSDKFRIKVKRNENWHESARLWCMLIGYPSFKKSPIIKAAANVVGSMDAAMLRSYNAEHQRWKDMGEQGPPPVPTRLRIEDITMEAAQEVCRWSPDGILCAQDELSGWFGGIEKYSGGKGGAKDRSFWLQSYGGGSYSVNRISRSSFIIDNLSVSILGGIQPESIRTIMASATDDGLIQRFIPIVLAVSEVGVDEEMPDVAAEYEDLVQRLHALEAPTSVVGDLSFRFDDEAQKLRADLERKHHGMVQSMEKINKKLSTHIGKYDGMFPRMCLLWHVIENVDATEIPLEINACTARRVARFLHDFVLRHAMAFYAGIVGLSEDQDVLEDVAGHILAHRLESVTMRTIQRGSRRMRKLTREEGARIFEQLEAMGWLEQMHRRSDAPSWKVNERVHELYEERAEKEAAERRETVSMIQAMARGNYGEEE